MSKSLTRKQSSYHISKSIYHKCSKNFGISKSVTRGHIVTHKWSTSYGISKSLTRKLSTSYSISKSITRKCSTKSVSRKRSTGYGISKNVCISGAAGDIFSVKGLNLSYFMEK